VFEVGGLGSTPGVRITEDLSFDPPVGADVLDAFEPGAAVGRNSDVHGARPFPMSNDLRWKLLIILFNAYCEVQRCERESDVVYGAHPLSLDTICGLEISASGRLGFNSLRPNTILLSVIFV
jgi:hypothetical protein